MFGAGHPSRVRATPQERPIQVGLIASPGEELHHLLDVVIHQINAENLTGVGSHAHDEIHAVDPINNQKTAVMTTDDEAPGAVFHAPS